MVRLENDTLIFTFPEVHEDAKLRVRFQRTLRIPDDGRDYPLPPGLGRFPMAHVDDHADRVPRPWKAHGGVMLPMYQSEAMWLSFTGAYPMAVKVAAGRINAVTGAEWTNELHRAPQDYVVTPNQPWLDGFVVEKGLIRQFVAMPLGAGYSAEEQITGQAEHGGVQLVAYPVRAEVWERILERRRREAALFDRIPMGSALRSQVAEAAAPRDTASMDMGLSAGGRMRQEIYSDHRDLSEWDTSVRSRCYVHLANSLVWRQVTGKRPPTTPPTAAEYERHGLPWFDYYGEGETAVEGSKVLRTLKSVFQIGKEKGDVPLPENVSVAAKNVVSLGARRVEGQVREGEF